MKHKKNISKFGKSSSALLKIKKNFISENGFYVQEQNKIAKLYSKQKKRLVCKNCNNKNLIYLFNKFNNQVKYYECSNCGHLNGQFVDTEDFCKKIYTVQNGATYAKNYANETKKGYLNRVKHIYKPKAEFLKNSLKKVNNINSYSILDVGCGSGYFVYALFKIGFINVKGIDVSKTQINFGNKINKFTFLEKIELENMNECIKKSKADIISLIGVLEHVQDPKLLLETIRKNRSIKYIYLSVPLFSLTVYLEIIFNNVYNRHLSGAHTHLYTEKSLDWLIKKYKFKKVSEWWFGLDINDLFRNIFVTLKSKGVSKKLSNNLKNLFNEISDNLQYELDKKKLSSEVHLLLKKK